MLWRCPVSPPLPPFVQCWRVVWDGGGAKKRSFSSLVDAAGGPTLTSGEGGRRRGTPRPTTARSVFFARTGIGSCSSGGFALRRGLCASAGNLKLKLPCVVLSTLLRLSLSSFLLSGISSMAPHLTAAEMDYMQNLHEKGKTPVEVHALLAARRAKKKQKAPHLTKVRKALKGAVLQTSGR